MKLKSLLPILSLGLLGAGPVAVTPNAVELPYEPPRNLNQGPPMRSNRRRMSAADRHCRMMRRRFDVYHRPSAKAF